MVAALLLMLLLAAPAPERPTVTTGIPAHGRLTVGDRFEVSLVVTAPSGSRVLGPLADSLGVFVVTDEKHSTQKQADAEASTYRLTLAGFRPGTHSIPVFRFLVVAGQEADTLASDTASVTIASVMPADMKDIHGLAPAETFPNVLLWLIPVAALLLAALAYLGVRLYRRLRRAQGLGQPSLPPWEEALQALDALAWREWLDAGQVKRYYYALSEVLKHYIERRFEFDAVEQTTTELLASMRVYKTPMRDDIGTFLARSDLVKYAKWVPPMEEAELAIGKVREFVLKTRPQEPVPVSAPVGRNPAAAEGSA